MTVTKRIAAAAALALLLAPAASAEEVRFPDSGFPALTVDLPAGWTHFVDSDNNFILKDSSRSDYSIVLAFADVSGSDATLDAYAGSIFKSAGASPPQDMGPVSVQSLRGYAYDGQLHNSQGGIVNLHDVLVLVPKDHLASLALITVDGISGADYQTVRAVYDTIRIESAP